MASHEIKDTTNSNEQCTKKNDVTQTDEDESEEETVDPFQHRLSMTALQWAKTIILGIVLVPIRLVLILTFMSIIWIVSSVSLRLVAKGKYIQSNLDLALAFFMFKDNF